MDIRIYYEDTDCGGVVYYANVLKYFERARTEYLRDRGIEVAAYAAVGLLFLVAHVEVDYRAPARYNDLLTLDSEVVDFTRTSLTFSHSLTRQRDDQLIAEGWVRLVCVDERGRPRRLPEDLVQTITKIV